MSNLPIQMDLDSVNDGPQAVNHIPRTHDWDWATLRQSPLRDFETVESSHELTMSHLKDFQDIVYGKKCFVLQTPENENKIWSNVVNNLISQSFQRKSPHVVGQSEDFQDYASSNWIQTAQALKAGLFKSSESDEGGIVYRRDSKGSQVEISATEMAILNTLSIGIPNFPSIRDMQIELEARQTYLESVQQMTRQMKDSYTAFLDLSTTLEQSCKDLEVDIQVGTEISKSRDISASNSHLQVHHEVLAPDGEIIDLTQESPQNLINDRQPSQLNDLVAILPAHTSAENIQRPETDRENGLQSTPSQVAIKDENPAMSSPPCQIEPTSSELHTVTETSNSNRNPSIPRSQRSSTPISTKDKPIKRNDMEKRQAVPFVQDLLSQGLNFEQIRERYKVKFGIWRTTASLKYYHSQHKHRHYLSTSGQPLRETGLSSINSTPPATSHNVGPNQLFWASLSATQPTIPASTSMLSGLPLVASSND